ncbi:heterogeneous nuclear ribonucleoprotein U-like protein 2 isoform X1 [Thunnus albacares]|uniref:heterogeneous nuclear ribonucleoprotein U-like protein 2 isoform X1 n=1 Tax=Thunnus albacares TaxID=8236 RepID=UPI001CF605FC|nr:heterogeneous nuclear ribonucleoprotein U-like protein 2 isoform X1 [Thunnus albacares]
MKLADIKKLKVAELRSRLKELDLDTKGLKAELVVRLWSAVEAGQGGEDGEEELELQKDDSMTPPTPAETVEVVASAAAPFSSPVATVGITAPCDGESAREFRESATQTEAKTSLQPGSAIQTKPKTSLQPGSATQTETKTSLQPGPATQTEAKTSLQPGPATQTEPKTSLQPGSAIQTKPKTSLQPGSATQTEAKNSVQTLQPDSECDSERVTVCQAEGGEQGRQQGGAEDPGEDRGRAFYEFKEEIRYKRAKSPQPPVEREEAEEEDEDKVRLDPYGGHLHFEVGPDGACGQPRFWDRFPSLWSGCRLSHGVIQGRVGFEVRLERKLLTTQDGDGTEHYGLRVGWSVANTSLLLGEEEVSFAYDRRGKKVSAGKEEKFGEPFSEGDIIGCYASFSTDHTVQLSFHKNGRFMGAAFSLDASVLQGCALFPHVLCKSCSVRFLLDPTAPPWYSSPPGFTPVAALPAGQRMRATSAPTSRAQCEVVLMVGLPGSGKSHWAATLMQQHPEKHYRLLGTEELLTCMISGGERDSRLRQASQCLTDLIKMAAKTPGNYILDQCNILFSAQRHKLQLFRGFRRRVVVVFPSAEEWRRRLSQHQTGDGEQIPETALLKLQVSCSLPEKGDLLEELQYVELPQEQAQTLLQKYKDEARRLLPPITKQEKKKHRLHKKRPYPHGPPPAHRIRWLNGWGDTRFNVQSWSQQPSYWNMAYQDQSYYYDNRDFGYGAYEGYW